MDILEVCRNIISIDSSAYLGVEDICVYYKKLADKMKLESFIHNSEGEISIQVGRKSLSEALVFHSHLDTKDPGPYSLWTKTNSNPFAISMIDDTLYGIGVADAKLNLFLQMLALRELKEASVDVPIVLLGVRENAFQAMTEAPAYLRTEKPRAVIVSKPTNFYIEQGICGRMSVEINLAFSAQESDLRKKYLGEESTATQTKIFRGEAGHAANQQLQNSESAVDKLASYLSKMPENILILNIEAGDKLDRVPSEALVELNLSQWVDDSIATKYTALMNQLVHLQQRYSSTYEENKISLPQLNVAVVSTEEAGLRVVVNFYFNEFYGEDKLNQDLSELLSHKNLEKCSYNLVELLPQQKYILPDYLEKTFELALDSAGMALRQRTSLFESDARNYHTLGIDCLKFGPGKGLGNISEPNESVKMPDLISAVQIYKKIMEQIK